MTDTTKIINGSKVEKGADLRGDNLEWVDLEDVNLEGANLSGVNLEGANLEKADLQGTNLQGANIISINDYLGPDFLGQNPPKRIPLSLPTLPDKVFFKEKCAPESHNYLWVYTYNYSVICNGDSCYTNSDDLNYHNCGVFQERFYECSLCGDEWSEVF